MLKNYALWEQIGQLEVEKVSLYSILYYKHVNLKRTALENGLLGVQIVSLLHIDTLKYI